MRYATFPPANVLNLLADIVSPASGRRRTSSTKSAFIEPTTTIGSTVAVHMIRCGRLTTSRRLRCSTEVGQLDGEPGNKACEECNIIT